MKYKIFWHWKDDEIDQYPPFTSLKDALNFIEKDGEFRPDLSEKTKIQHQVLENTKKIEIVFRED